MSSVIEKRLPTSNEHKRWKGCSSFICVSRDCVLIDFDSCLVTDHLKPYIIPAHLHLHSMTGKVRQRTISIAPPTQNPCVKARKEARLSGLVLRNLVTPRNICWDQRARPSNVSETL